MNGKGIGGVPLALLCAALSLPAGPALAAAASVGPDWVLAQTRTVRQFVPTPPKIGKGKWKVKTVLDRRYFVGTEAVDQTEEASLISSKLLRTEVEKTAERHSIERDLGEPRVSEDIKETEDEGPTIRKSEGRRINLYLTAIVTRIKETRTTTPYQDWDDVSWEERIRKTLGNTYAVNRELAFTDPVTSERMQSRSSRSEAPVEEIAFTPWETKTERRKGEAGEKVVTNRTVVGTKQVSKLQSSALVADGSVTIGGAETGLLRDPGLSVAAARGANGAAVYENTDDLTGARRARAKGGSGAGEFDFEAVSAAAHRGMLLVDDRGDSWWLFSTGVVLCFTPETGPTVTISRGSRTARQGRVEVRIDEASVRDGKVTIAGAFSWGKAGEARALASR